MRRMLVLLRRLLGIRDYVPGAIPPALVRRSTRYGARGNGHMAGLPPQPVHPVIDHLTRQHRAIRQMIADVRKRGGA